MRKFWNALRLELRSLLSTDEERAGDEELRHLRNLYHLQSALVDTLQDNADKVAPMYRACMQDRNALLTACHGVVSLAKEAHLNWDADDDAKVGKKLMALAGHIRKYDDRADALHVVIERMEKRYE